MNNLYKHGLVPVTHNTAHTTYKNRSIASAKSTLIKLFTLILLISSIPLAKAQNSSGLPAGFVEEQIGGEWNMAVGLRFSKDGKKLYVWEKAGKVWYVENGQKSAEPIIDISEEVGDWGDHGLLGFELDPNFEQNGYIYLLYVVDRHHLLNFGTANYSPTKNSYNEATIGRLTRYTVNAGNGKADMGSRKILLGQTITTGIPILYISHGVGSLAFGQDGSLLVSAGDGATANGVDYGYDPNDPKNDTFVPQGLIDGIIPDKQDVGAFRSQQLQSYNGKILRIDPATGNGLPSNPFYKASAPQSVESKVWALGLRNPFRFTIRPGTGGASSPGVIYVGDVGWMDWEEISIIEEPGMNLGWPMFEGLMAQPSYFEMARVVENQYTPNPLYTGPTTGQNSDMCKEFYTFGSLLKQARKTTQPEFLNPCDNATAISDDITFVHKRPMVDWVNDIVQNGVAPAAITRTGTFNGEEATTVGIGEAGSPVSGEPFYGSSSTGGIWYTANDLPATYKNTYFFGDYGAGWIKNAVFDANNNLTSIRKFINEGATVTGFATNPVTGGLYYIGYATKVMKIAYYGDNLPPVAVAKADKLFGISPLTVKFTGSESSDPEGKALKYEWDFGDGSAKSTQANPEHTFTGSGSVTRTVTLKVTDDGGLSNTATLTITLNNTPPVVNITSPAEGTLYPMDKPTTYTLKADATDGEHSGDDLKYEWQTTLHHNTHSHPEPVDTKKETTTTITPIGCDGETYFYRISLKVTDAGGLSTTDFVDVYPNCNNGIVNAVKIKSPTANASFEVGEAVNLEVELVQENRNWTKVVYYAGSTQIAESSTSPFKAVWQNPTRGTHNITAQATEDGVHFSTSEGVNISVGSSGGGDLGDCLPGITHYFGFDETSAESGFTDYSSASVATCTDCPDLTTGKLEGAVNFTGNTGINIEDGTKFNWGADSPFTISFWMKSSTSSGNNAVIIGRNAVNSSMHWWIGLNPQGQAVFMLRDVNHIGDLAGNAGPSLTDGNWHYVTAVRNPETNMNMLYVDGVKVGELYYNYDNGFEGTAPINIGYMQLGDGFHYSGSLDEVKLYERALTEADIAEEYNGGAGNYCGSSPLGSGKDVNFTGKFEVYPNPATGGQTSIMVTELQPNERLTVVVTDATGRKVMTRETQAAPSGSLNLKLAIPAINAGLYNVTLMSAERSISRKLIITD